MPNCTRSHPHRLSSLSLLLLAAASIGGCGGNGDDGDRRAPTVTLSAPSGTVNRTVTLTANATDNRAVTQVEFLVDGTVVNTDTSAPYSFDLNTSGLADGAHQATARATDEAGNVTTSTAVTLNVLNNLSFNVALSGDQENPATGSAATGEGQLQVNLLTGAATGNLVVSGMTPTAAHIHDGFAGTNGPVLIPFEARAGTTDTFDVPANTTMTPEQLDKLETGALYLNAHSAAFPSGEIRGQIVPDGVAVVFTNLSDDEVIESVRSLGSGRAALTVNTGTNAAVAHVQLQDVDGVSAVHLDQGAAGTAGSSALALAADSADPNHWFATGTLAQAATDALASGQLHFDVETAANPSGELRGQVLPAGVELGIARLSGFQEVPAVDSTLSGFGAITVDSNAGNATVHVVTTGSPNPTGASVKSAVGGREGAALATLTQDGSNPAHWSGTTNLTAADIEAFRRGGLYVEMPSQANADGELRGQFAPPGILFISGPLSVAQEVPAKTTQARGMVAVTIDRATRALELHANTSGVDDATAAHIHTAYAGANGPVTIGLTKDPADPTHWSGTGVTLTEEQFDAIEHGETYVNVHTPANPGGEIRGQLVSDLVQVEFDTLTGDQEVPAVATTATGTAATTVDFDERTVSIHVHTDGVDDATAAHIHHAPAGTNGPVLVPMSKDAADAGHWSAIDQPITPTDIADFLAGNWYANVHTPDHAGGEIRAQIGTPETPPPPPTDTTAPTVTLDAVPANVSGTVTLTATATDDVGVTSVRFLAGTTEIGTDSTAPYSVQWNTTTSTNGQVSLTAEARDAAGNAGTSAAVTTTVNNAAAVTLATLQSSIFGPRCSSCHSGGGGGLPGSMNLSNANASFAALVNVPSQQQSALMRVKPNDAENSYLVHKLEGRATITGDRMPQGGPFLTAEQIESVKAWINAGAQNN
jgi:hypothetical protein